MLSRRIQLVHWTLVHGGKLIVAMAATWAVGASIFIFFLPVSTHGVTDLVFRNSSTVLAHFTSTQSWYNAQGLWGVLLLMLFSGHYLLAVHVAWRGKYVALVFLSLAACAFCIVTGFSVGVAYLPAALAMFIGSLVLLSSKLVRARC